MLSPDTIEIRIGLSPEEKRILERVAAAARIPLRHWIRERIFRLAALEMMGVSAVLPYAKAGQDGVIEIAKTGYLVEAQKERDKMEAKERKRREQHEKKVAERTKELERQLASGIRRRAEAAARRVVGPYMERAKATIIGELDHIARNYLPMKDLDRVARRQLHRVLTEAGRRERSKSALPEWLKQHIHDRQPTSEEIEELVGQRIWGDRWERVKYIRQLSSKSGTIGVKNRWHKT